MQRVVLELKSSDTNPDVERFEVTNILADAKSHCNNYLAIKPSGRFAQSARRALSVLDNLNESTLSKVTLAKCLARINDQASKQAAVISLSGQAGTFQTGIENLIRQLLGKKSYQVAIEQASTLREKVVPGLHTLDDVTKFFGVFSETRRDIEFDSLSERKVKLIQDSLKPKPAETAPQPTLTIYEGFFSLANMSMSPGSSKHDEPSVLPFNPKP